MNPDKEIRFLPFQAEDQAAVKALILAGLAGHWGTLDLSLNPDLNDIGRSYAGAYFLVAWQGQTVVGTGALVPLSADTAQIVRMSVAAGLRRKGIGGQILARLCDHARLNGLQKIILETTATWQDVIEFYQTHGFRITHYQDGDAYFVLALSA
ncbi:N-acetylglutamate synthase [Longilinea arvoryzae]|uniref:N-acetylglutamate synthase n=1 Tax=Longilinea arvoryzae TaxID=360412 RepID=A0A0S7BFZ1_9CHLR|nr:GNAT family N-acetyltransferase [Longilinea arvoryzae]GAP12689.1 N-acetylglutamate synthase [Longilinea arvoryzae]